ncbi:hypothetical protein [Myxosarcina sp. GI1]|uniref:hypothetical protein n=1 Tax=Myxosarcina sp. GI1 TaxID=1541065 RepID=UPI00056AA536|nr:hypothetical protein [Myxosarcina sp. GI1]
MKFYSELGYSPMGFLLGISLIILSSGATYSMVRSREVELKGAGISLQVVNRLKEVQETNQELEETIDQIKQTRQISSMTIDRLDNTIKRNQEKLESTSQDISETIDELTNEQSKGMSEAQ